ncbi:MAG TPA: hypothetical protein VGC13_31790 [Longimicrobium sp.]|jgi:hypothetical protein|uniref:hypothetical protein n=1 Tax=Longimicrobium sp. TaxID=2029185 RepID=UPI002ED953F0
MIRSIAWISAVILGAAPFSLGAGAGTSPNLGAAESPAARAARVGNAPAAFLSASLNGPNSVRPNVQCYWWGQAAGGTPPYSWTFSGGLSGWSIGYEYFTTSPGSGSFTVSATVTDALGATATTSQVVSVNSRASICPY